MLWRKPRKEGSAQSSHREGELNEASSNLSSHRRRRRGAAAIAAPAIAQSMPEIKWRMTTSWPKSLDTLFGGAEMMAKAVAEATDNKFQIQVFAGGEIVPGLQVVDAVQNGTVEMRPYRVVLLFRQGPDLRLRHLGRRSAPISASTRAGTRWAAARKCSTSSTRNTTCISLLAGNTGCQMGGWFRKEINTVDDLKGLKMRIGGFPGRVLQKLGAVPQQIAAGDIYPALEKGTIDAAEWVGPYDDEKLGFYKVAPHYYYPGWWEGGSMLMAFVNLDKWNALPKNYQAILEQAGAYANKWMMAKYDLVNPPALRRLLADGTKLHGVLAGDHGSLLQGGAGIARRDRADQCKLQEGLRFDERLHRSQAISGSRSPNWATTTFMVRHNNSLIATHDKRKPRSRGSGVFYCHRCRAITSAAGRNRAAAAARSAESRSSFCSGRSSNAAPL